MLKKIWSREPLMIVTVLGGILLFALDNWQAVAQLLSAWGVADVWLDIILMFLTALVGRSFVTPAKK